MVNLSPLVSVYTQRGTIPLPLSDSIRNPHMEEMTTMKENCDHANCRMDGQGFPEEVLTGNILISE